MEQHEYDTTLKFELYDTKEVIEFYEIAISTLAEYNFIIESTGGCVLFVENEELNYRSSFRKTSEMKLFMRKNNAIDHTISLGAHHNDSDTTKIQIDMDWSKDDKGIETRKKIIECGSNDSDILIDFVERLEAIWYEKYPESTPRTDSKIDKKTSSTTEAQVTEEYSELLYINKRKGTKTDFVRIINVLWELEFFVTEQQNKVSKAEVFRAINRIFGDDFSTHEQILSRSMSDNTKLDKHISIFDSMKQKMTSIFNRK